MISLSFSKFLRLDFERNKHIFNMKFLVDSKKNAPLKSGAFFSIYIINYTSKSFLAR